MTMNLFLMLLTIFSVVSSLVTQAIKKTLNNKLADNLIVLLTTLIVGGAGTIVAYISFGIPFTTVNIMYAILLVLAEWLGACLGFDKVKQTLKQIDEIVGGK